MLIGSTYDVNIPQYSPDGRKIAFQSNRSGNMEVWTCDADGANCQQLTSFGGPQCGTPRWSPDGRWLALDSRVGGAVRDLRDCGGRGHAAPGDRSRRLQQLADRVGRATAVGSISAPTGAVATRSGRCRQRVGQTVQVTRSGGRCCPEFTGWGNIYYVKPGRPPGLVQNAGRGRRGDAGGGAGAGWGSFGVTTKGIYFSAGGTLQFPRHSDRQGQGPRGWWLIVAGSASLRTTAMWCGRRSTGTPAT